MTFNVVRKSDGGLVCACSTFEEAESRIAAYTHNANLFRIEPDVSMEPRPHPYRPLSASEYKYGVEIHSTPVAVKHDQQKPDYSLLPLADLEGLVEVLQYGSKKYTRDNWKQGGGHDPNRLIAACLRHLALFQDGQALDSESGLSHIHHAACNLVFLMRQIRLAKVNTGSSDSVTKGDTND